MNIKMIKEFLEWVEDIMPYLDVVEESWSLTSDCVICGIVDEDDYSYSAELRGDVLRKDGLVVMNTDNGCGETVTRVFLEEKEVK